MREVMGALPIGSRPASSIPAEGITIAETAAEIGGTQGSSTVVSVTSALIATAVSGAGAFVINVFVLCTHELATLLSNLVTRPPSAKNFLETFDHPPKSLSMPNSRPGAG